MLNLLDKLRIYIDKYKDKIVEAISDRDNQDVEEVLSHTKALSDTSSGKSSSRNYTMNLIKTIIKQEIRIPKNELEEIADIVRNEYDILINKKYNKYSDDEKLINYYQLVDLYKPSSYDSFLKKINIKDVTGIDEFAEAIYMDTYGNSYIDVIDRLLLNNIEVHGDRKILIETPKGRWKTIENYRFKDEDKIKSVADHLVSQGTKGQLTDDNCVMESTMLNGNRITIALKPASEEHNIFIKKFNGFSFSSMKDMIKIGEVTEEQYNELAIYAKGRANLSIIGGINSGKTTFMKAYVGLIPDEYKIGTLESDFEAHLIPRYPDKDIVSLAATRKFNENDLFIKMLRMNRNILALGEARSYEVEQWIKSATRGADGSFTTGHSRTVHDLINNMAWMALEGGLPMDIRILRYRIASALDIVVRLWHSPTGERYVDSIDEIITVHDNLDMPYKVNNLYKYDLDEEKIIKTGNISLDLREKFRYYKCTKEEINSIINPKFEKEIKK